MGKQGDPLGELFTSTGEVKHRIELSPCFLRKPYQYTLAEPKGNDQQALHEDDWLLEKPYKK